MDPPRIAPLPERRTWIRLEVDPVVLGVGAKTKR
jgi:hypothetical protein